MRSQALAIVASRSRNTGAVCTAATTNGARGSLMTGSYARTRRAPRAPAVDSNENGPPDGGPWRNARVPLRSGGAGDELRGAALLPQLLVVADVLAEHLLDV